MDTVLENSSDCSSGCESGWTMYFENSSNFQIIEPIKTNDILDFNENKRRKESDEEKEEEKDLSLISDASSGPPIFLEDNEEEEEEVYYINSSNYHAPPTEPGSRKKSGKIKKTKDKHCKKVFAQYNTLLDEHDSTASSTVSDFSDNKCNVMNNYAPSEKMVDISEGYYDFQSQSTRYYN